MALTCFSRLKRPRSKPIFKRRIKLLSFDSKILPGRGAWSVLQGSLDAVGGESLLPLTTGKSQALDED